MKKIKLKSYRRRRHYAQDVKENIIKDISQMGISGAANKHGIPISTLSTWLHTDKKKLSSKMDSSCLSSQKEGDDFCNNKNDDEYSAPSSVDLINTEKDKKPKVAKYYSPSQKKEILDYANSHSITEASDKFRVTRFSIYNWQRKLILAKKGEGNSPISGPDKISIEEQRDKEIINEWKRHPGLGPSQIKNQLRRKNIKVSIHTTRRVMEDNGYRPPKIKREPHENRFESIRPNHLWHIDFVQRFINKASTFSMFLLDDFSRYVTGFGVDDAEKAGIVIETFEEAVNKHGKPEMVMHDKGSAFWSWKGISRFTALLTEMGIDQIVAEKKEWNGKIEAFNGNIHKEFFDVHKFSSISEMRHELEKHINWYNHARTHHALGGILVPADRFYGRVEEVLAKIEPGVNSKPGINNNIDIDPYDIKKRSLDLFKVVFKDGLAEFWFMGKKIFKTA